MKSLTCVDHAFGTHVIFAGASVDLPDRGVVALRGANGCGKTTLLRLLGGMLSTTCRDIALLRQKLSIVYLDTDFLTLDYLSVQEQLNMVETLTSRIEMPNQTRPCLLTKQMLSTRVGDLSLGQRQRLVLTVALALKNVDVLLLDEPLNGLDHEGASIARESILRYGEKRLVIVATHETDQWTDFNLMIHQEDAIELSRTSARI